MVSYTYDDAGQLTTESKVDSSSATLYSLLYTYDDAGNTTSVYNSVSGITTSLTWDAEERMTGVSNDATTSAISDTYTYNGLDQRVGKGGTGGGQIFTRADDAIDSPVLQDWMATYNYGAGNELISEVHDLSPTPQSRFYMSDALGTTRAVRDDTGTLRDVLDCDAFGNALSSTMGNTQPPFGFGGKAGYQTDLDTGLMLLGHRFYDSSTGRFLSRDPIQDGYNWYVYCTNDPLNRFDPQGLNGGTGARSGIVYNRTKTTSVLVMADTGNEVAMFEVPPGYETTWWTIDVDFVSTDQGWVHITPGAFGLYPSTVEDTSDGPVLFHIPYPNQEKAKPLNDQQVIGPNPGMGVNVKTHPFVYVRDPISKGWVIPIGSPRKR